MKKVISTNKAPAALGPYSQAILAGNTLYVSGQLGIDPATGDFAAQDAPGQARQALENLKAILGESGATAENVVKTTVLLANISDFTAVNEIYAQVFRTDPPARSCFQVACLPKNALVEIEAIAVI